MHKLTQVNLEAKTAVCVSCGPTLIWTDPKNKRRPRCLARRELGIMYRRAKGERIREAARQITPRKFCRVVKVDRESLTGVCAKCGPVEVKPRQFGKYFTCITSWKTSRSLQCTSSGHGLTRAEVSNFIHRIGVCQNQGCGKLLNGPGNRHDQGHVDHDHASGAIRGVLCSLCNHALGMVGDNAGVLIGLVDYLNNPPGCSSG